MDSRHGPGNVTQVLIDNGLTAYHEHGTMLRDVRLYARAAFYPYHWNEPFDAAKVTSETFLVHQWARSWVPDLREEARPEHRGLRDGLGAAANFLHLRAQWRLERWPALQARYHHAVAAAASGAFGLRRLRISG